MSLKYKKKNYLEWKLYCISLEDFNYKKGTHLFGVSILCLIKISYINLESL